MANVAEEAVYKANWTRYGLPCENPAAYVLTIFRRDADQYLKRRSLVRSIDERGYGYANVAGSSSADIERRVLVRELLDNMDDITRSILLRRVEGESPRDIGRALGLSANAVSIRWSRALAELRKLLIDRNE
jgi:DNA-directed RNA polymerase specialized sigma24 family protein